MALPTVAQLKAYLRVETTAEDAQFTLWLARATALVEGVLGQAITGASRTVIVTPFPHPVTGYARLLLPWPLAASVTVTDDQGDAVASSTYTLDVANGILTFDEDAEVASWYSVAVTTGWDQVADYATTAEPLISQAITDTVADWYQRRNPAASQESEASASASYGELGLPRRVIAALEPLLRKGIR